MTPITDQQILDTMERYGGSFASHLAKAWQHADDNNAARLRNGFGDLLEKYRAVTQDLQKPQDHEHE